MFGEALTYPLRGDREETLVVGAVLAVAAGILARLGVLAAFALVPAVLLAGYALAVLRESAESADDRQAADGAPPAFADFRALAVDGVRTLAVAGGYLLVPAVALAVTVAGAAGGGGAGGRPPTAGTAAFVVGAGTVVLFVSLSFAYLLPAALAAVARTGTVRTAVDLGRLRRSAGDAGYFLGWVGAALVAGASVVVLGALASLGRPGEVVALAGGFYSLVAVARLVGKNVE